MQAAEILPALAFKCFSRRYVNKSLLAHGEVKILQEEDTVSFGGGRMIRQANMMCDQTNPFIYKLADW